MGAPSFKECIAADVFNVFLNKLEFADTHTVNGKKMAVLVDENELLERDKAKLGTHADGVYKSRRLIYVAQVDFGPRPAIKAVLTLDGRAYRVTDCTAEAGILAIELDGKEHQEESLVKQRDRQKMQVCRKHGFELIRVENSYARRYYYIKGILEEYFRKIR